MDWMNMSALEVGKKIKAKEIGVEEVTKAALDRIAEKDKDVNAFITVCADEAMAQAKKVQKGIDERTLTSPLAGVPMAVKDNMCTKGILTTCASKILTGFKPFYSSTAVNRLEEAGAVILGKLNMDEFAMGSTSETSFYGPVVNPWGSQRSPAAPAAVRRQPWPQAKPSILWVLTPAVPSVSRLLFAA